MQVITPQPRKVHLISLGCARNRVDSEVMLGTLLSQGWEMTDEPEESDAIVVNTCGFIQAAKEESIDTILSAAELKKNKPSLKVVVAGCLTQRYKKQLADGLPEVDLFIGTDEFPKIAALVDAPAEGKLHAKRTHYIYSEAMPRTNTLARHSAYVKVAEGCQHNCSFCIIPAIRGRLRSRPVDSVIAEATQLVTNGVREVNLIAQDLAAYGRDWQGGGQFDGNLLSLLRRLVKVDGLEWIRMLYMYPENIEDQFLELMATEDKIVKYLDVPMQHGSDRILKAMNRDVNRDQLNDSVARLRAAVPSVAVRTTVMVGFPGETEEDFQELLGFVEHNRFDHLGCFAYSREEGTVAGRMPDQVPEEVKQERLERIMERQREISKERLLAYVGKEVDVLTHGASAESDLLWEGRMANQAPEVDGVVYLADGPVRAGEIQRVRIVEAHDYDLVGHVLP